jgi:hypothetical protein
MILMPIPIFSKIQTGMAALILEKPFTPTGTCSCRQHCSRLATITRSAKRIPMDSSTTPGILLNFWLILSNTSEAVSPNTHGESSIATAEITKGGINMPPFFLHEKRNLHFFIESSRVLRYYQWEL